MEISSEGQAAAVIGPVMAYCLIKAEAPEHVYQRDCNAFSKMQRGISEGDLFLSPLKETKN